MKAQSSSTRNNWDGDFSLLIEQLSSRAKQPSPRLGESPKEALYQENKLSLFHYKPHPVKQKSTPILIVYALVNRPDIADLEPKRSLVQRLLEQGYPVYLIDWGYPDSTDCQTSLNDYINGYLHRCVQHVKRDTKVKKIDLLGICQGGVFSLCYSALHLEDIRKLITLVTPVDFHSADNLLSKWTSETNMKRIFNASGNIPSHTITQLFKTLKPYQLNREKYRQLSNLVKSPNQLNTFLRMEQWLNNGPDLAGKAAIEFAECFYQENGFIKHGLRIGGKSVSLKNISCPVLNVYATQDHIVPPSSSKALRKQLKKNLYHEQQLESGHIGAFTSLKTQKVLISAIQEWLD
ncbi:MAG: class III poly(R)-hydroxyalkanoic acid synthase subunit PhaC [Cycloclasticus sp. symbiont of Poecilosclerida sp. M]|nr:MAG: class III poly(R)-hydroxyalkanoic acid synthase subunit PhaC [Cycloclasticus sp. symbiont of Poecilosclerida sp. M]